MGRLIINADDWGFTAFTTQKIFECSQRRRISSVSAMVFMQDSGRAADIAQGNQIDAGLHLNLTARFDSPASSELQAHQEKVSQFLLASRWSQAIFHPALARSFEYTVSAQIEEFARLYGNIPKRIDGHHHMHLCANVILGRLIPTGTVVRRSFSFEHGEKGFANVVYRRTLNRMLGKRYRLADYLFSLEDLLKRERVEEVLTLAKDSVVEVETHPVEPDEYSFLTTSPLIAGDLVAHTYMDEDASRLDEACSK